MQFFPHSILNFPHSVGHFLTSTSSLFSLFLVGGFSTPLNKISSSMGRMTSHIYPYTIHYYIYPIYEMENKIHVPNHQPGLVVQPHGYCYNPTPLRRFFHETMTATPRVPHHGEGRVPRAFATLDQGDLENHFFLGGIRGMTTSHHQPIRPTLW